MLIPWLLLTSTLLFALPSTTEPVDVIAQNISIQQTNETFFAYIPLSSDCIYPKDGSILPYSIDYTLLDAPAIYSAVTVTGEVSFWGVMADGLRMLVNADSLLLDGTYTQVLLFNSTIPSNLTQRQLILTSFSLLGDIIFTFAEPAYNYTGNILTPTIVSQQSFALGAEIQLIVRECNKGGRWIWITYAGGNNFMGVCPNTTDIFVWSIDGHTQPYLYSEISFLNGSSIQNITSNPYLLFPQVPNITIPPRINRYDWDVVLLTQGGGSCFFCKANLTSLRC